MSHTPNTATITSTFDPTPTGPIQLACPSCGSPDHLHAVELVEVLVEARFVLGRAEPETGESSQLLADTQHWHPRTGAIVCRNCDQVDLRYGDLIPVITLTDRTRAHALAHMPTPGATS